MKIKAISWIVFGVVLFNVAVWGGSYVISVYGTSSLGFPNWRLFPLLISMTILIGLSVGCIFHGVTKLLSQIKRSAR